VEWIALAFERRKAKGERRKAKNEKKRKVRGEIHCLIGTAQIADEV